MSQFSQNNFVVHQLLHGYSEGHSLIASSIPQLNSEVRRAIGILTDMSGPNLQNGFEEYITGYPLNDIGMYAIAKTWYAAEMPRPGSVWTQTLLISFSDLPKLSTPGSFLPFFKRPSNSKKNWHIEYGETIQLATLPTSYETPNIGASLEQLQVILTALYQNPEHSIIIKANNTRTFERLVLEIWLQQWPRLRRNFSFCTGAIYPRSINNRFFDLQICPTRVESSFNIGPQFIVLDFSSQQAPGPIAGWSKLAAQDLQTRSPVRDFLRMYGADAGLSRNTLISLVAVYNFISNTDKKEIADILSFLAGLFPGQGDAETLKVDLLVSEERNVNRLVQFSEQETLIALSSTEHYDAFNYEKLQFIDRFFDLYYNASDVAVSILNRLVDNELNPWGEQLLQQVAERINESEFKKLARLLDRRLAFSLASQNNGLLTSDFFWQSYKAHHRELVSILLRYKKPDDTGWIRVIDILMKINSDVATQLPSDSTVDLTHPLLAWSNHYNSNNVNYSWQNLLRARPKSVLDWFQSTDDVSENTLRLIIANLNPNSKEVIQNGSTIWVNKIVKLQARKQYDALTAVAAFSLALALNKPDKYYLELVSRSFEPVYNALKHDALPYGLWYPIEVHTKPLSWYNDWDKCKKLIDALFHNFTEVRWSKSQVNILFANEELRERIWARYKKKFAP